MIVDTHCHIQFKGLENDLDGIIERCRKRGTILNLVGTQKDTSKRAVELAMKHDDMYASIGTHPNHLFPTYVTEEESSFMTREEDFDDEYYESLFQMAPEKIIGVGETGLDLFHVPDPKEVPTETVLEKQKSVFLKHYQFAKKHDLPLVIHVRDAHEHMLELLESLNEHIRATIHCYTGNWEQAQRYLALGCYLGFTGVITFPPKKTKPEEQEQLLDVVKHIPLDKIIVETDAPYLAPQAYRGKRSEPWMCEEQIAFIAEMRGLLPAELEDQILANSKLLFTKIV